MRKNNKGFTLIELLAVIVILGLLMAIAIPSVTRYITQSRRKIVVTSIDSYVTSVMTEVNDGEYHFSDAAKVYAVPIECVSLEKGGTNPFGNWMQANTNYWAYVLVQYDSENYNYVYGFTFKDDAGYGMYPTSHANIDEKGSQIKTGLELTRPETGLITDVTNLDNWNNSGFKVDTNTQLIVLEAGSEGEIGDGETTCTLCQKGNNYNQVEEEKKTRPRNLVKLIKEHNPDIKSNPTLTTTSQEAGENGLYVSTETNSGKPTYYFRGDVRNNIVKFANLTWEIIRINEDGTIRLMLKNAIKYTYFNTKSSDYEYMYYSESSVKSIVDAWYIDNIDKIGYDSYVADGIFCEQAKVTYSKGVASGNVVMDYYTKYKPSFDCNFDGNGKGILYSKIGLITIDEALHAGGIYGRTNSHYYLYNGMSGFWTMSPAGIHSNYVVEWVVSGSGDIGINGVEKGYRLQPVINLKANVKAVGTGTSDDPYVIQTN